MKIFSVLGEGCNKKIFSGVETNREEGKTFIKLGEGKTCKKIFVGHKDHDLIVDQNGRITHGDIIEVNRMKLIVFPNEFVDDKILLLWRVPYDVDMKLNFFSPDKINIVMLSHYRGEKSNRLDIFTEIKVYEPLICKRIPKNGKKLDYVLESLYYDGENVKVNIM